MKTVHYALEPVLVCDMAALIKVLGLYTCYHPKSQWKCPWCLGEEAAKLKSNSAKKRFAATNFGIQDKPLLRILFNHVIPCQLHCFMGVMRKLVEQLAEYTHGKKKLCKEVEKCFVAAKITLPKRNDKMKTLKQRVAKARFGRPDYICILENQALFLKAVEKRARRRKSQERAANIKQLWNHFALLASLASQPKVTITENEWLELAQEFGTKFTQAFGNEEVTPYIHVFIYHLGFFLEKYGSVERFANYATESRHFQNKHIPTNGHSIQGSDKKNFCYQQLAYSYHQELYRTEGTLPEPQQKRRRTKRKEPVTWASKGLKAHPEIHQYLPLEGISKSQPENGGEEEEENEQHCS
ncbi:hypothetical protein QOT17_001609 [Balamuthia mandrillaris]